MNFTLHVWRQKDRNASGQMVAYPAKDISPDMMTAVDRCDAARFSRDEILAPKRWDLLNFVMDPRTGMLLEKLAIELPSLDGVEGSVA